MYNRIRFDCSKVDNKVGAIKALRLLTGESLKEAKDAVAADAGPVNNWVPVNDSRVIGSTVLIGPGESGQATFTAPPAGIYQFVCTFPGHNFTMFGDFVVAP